VPSVEPPSTITISSGARVCEAIAVTNSPMWSPAFFTVATSVTFIHSPFGASQRSASGRPLRPGGLQQPDPLAALAGLLPPWTPSNGVPPPDHELGADPERQPREGEQDTLPPGRVMLREVPIDRVGVHADHALRVAGRDPAL